MIKRLLYLSCVAALIFTSCSKNLDILPVDQISNEQYWKTGNDLNTYVLQFYSSFPTFRNQSGFHGIIGADAYSGSDHQIQQVPVALMNGTRTATVSGGQWNWSSIRAVNIFFENYQKVKEPAANIAQYVGEAHFFKAWFYFQKVKAYGDVPWYTKSMVQNDPHLYDPRMPRTQVVDSILYHLDEAVAKLRFLKDNGGEGNNRLSKEAALIFKSRVALYEGSWQKYHMGTPFATSGATPNKYFQAAVDAATELMTPGKYRVGITNTGKPASDYNSQFNATNLSGNNEVILWGKFDKNLVTFSHNFQQFITIGTNQLSITRELVLNYLKKDGTPFDYDGTAATVKGSSFLTKIGTDCDPRLSQVIWTPGQTMWDNTSGKVLFVKPSLNAASTENKNYTGFQMNKGVDPKDPTAGAALGFSTSCETGAVVFRYAEALLNYAEAQAEMGKAVDYASSLNRLRARAGMPNFTVQSDVNRSKYADFGYSLSDELYEIRRERAVELACEGFRSDDWRRWRAHNLFKGKRPSGFPYLASEYAGFSVPTNDLGFIDPLKTALPGGYNFNVGRDYLDNIPTNEITLNPKLTPNPGW